MTNPVQKYRADTSVGFLSRELSVSCKHTKNSEIRKNSGNNVTMKCCLSLNARESVSKKTMRHTAGHCTDLLINNFRHVLFVCNQKITWKYDQSTLTLYLYACIVLKIFKECRQSFQCGYLHSGNEQLNRLSYKITLNVRYWRQIY